MEMISEKDYQERMDSQAVPCLEKTRHTGYFNPDGTGNLYYERYGDRQAKAVVVMVHGFSETAEKYVEMIYYFLQAGYRVYIPDMRGHGRSVRATADLSLVHIGSYEQYLTDLEYLVEKIVKKENPKLPLYLYAHSMGGGIGAAFLERHPETFRKAVLSSPMIRLQTGGIPVGAARIIAGAQVRAGKGKEYVAGQHGFRGDETFENSASSCRPRYEYYYQKRLKEKLFQNSGASYAWLLEAAKLSCDILKKSNCRKIRTELLLFQAERDDFVDNQAQEKFVGLVPNARLVPVPGTKHEIYLSQDAVLQSYIEQILEFFYSSFSV